MGVVGKFFPAILGIIAFVAFAITLESKLGVPFALTFRVTCACICLYLIRKLASDFPGEKWPTVALALATMVNLALFFSPLKALPASKGDILFFAAPDALIMLAARSLTYPVSDVHQRALRQQLIMGTILAAIVCAILMAILLIPQSNPGASKRFTGPNVHELRKVTPARR